MFGLTGLSPEILGVLSKLGEYGQEAIKLAMLEKAKSLTPDPDRIAEQIYAAMVEWEPMVKKHKLADPVTRRAAARFLAGIACNLSNPIK